MSQLALLGGRPPLLDTRVPRDRAVAGVDGVDAVVSSLESGNWSMFSSTQVAEFEQEFAEYVGADHAVLVNSCTTAILAALTVTGIAAGDLVAVPAFTYVGTCMPLLELGASPVWVDVESHAPNMNPDALRTELEIRDVRAAVIPLLFGSSAAIDRSVEVCTEAGTEMIFDCAQFLGDRSTTSWLNSIGMCCFSFGESKLLRMGEGGAVTTNSDRLAEAVRRFRHEGESWLSADSSSVDLEQITPLDVLESLASTQTGLNLRPIGYSAALGRVQLRDLPQFLAATSANAESITTALGGDLPIELPQAREVWWTYPCIIREPLDRSVVVAALLAEGVPVGVHFPRLLPDHPIFRRGQRTYTPGAFPGARHFADRHIVLPIYPAIDPSTAERIGNVVCQVLRDPDLNTPDARTRAENFLGSRPLADLSSGLYMFVEYP